MKKRMTKPKLIPLLFLLTAAVIFASCETNYQKYNTDYEGIYFVKDSIYYSFGITPLDTVKHKIKIPVRIMGIPVKEARDFTVVQVKDKSTASEGDQYKLPDEFTIQKDSVNGFVAVELLRSNLKGDNDYKLTLKLVKNDNFTPINKNQSFISITFNNKVVPPPWTDFNGQQAWPSFQLGPYNEVVYIEFLKFFRKMEIEAPVTYQSMVDEYGENLQDMRGKTWPYDFNYSMTKYVLQPLFDFFKANPQYNVQIPNPY